MPLSQNDRDWVKLVARELAYKAIKETLAMHIQACPHGQRLGNFKAYLCGVAIGLALAGFGSGVAVAKLIPW